MSDSSPPFRFCHRIVERRGTYEIQSTCLSCGAHDEARPTADVVRWEASHKCLLGKHGPAENLQES